MLGKVSPEQMDNSESVDSFEASLKLKSGAGFIEILQIFGEL
jgi:hypothetical protein